MQPMTIVDAHVHFMDLELFHYPWLDAQEFEPLRASYLPAHFVVDAGQTPVAAVVHVQAEVSRNVDPVAETAWLAELQGSVPGLPPLTHLGYADLRDPQVEDLLARHMAFDVFRGVRQEAWFDPHSQRADIPRVNVLDDPAWARGLAALALHGLVFDLLVWPSQLQQSCDLFREQPGLAVVLEHTGVPIAADEDAIRVWREGLRRFAAEVESSVLKISAMAFIRQGWSIDDVRPVVEEAIELFGPDRCMFASNYPCERPNSSYRDLWQAYAEVTSGFTADERRAMFSGTAARTYRLKGVV